MFSTQRERDDESTLIYFRARHYTPYTSRFICRDPLLNNLASKHYIYCDNNPLINTDPTGYDTKQQKVFIIINYDVAKIDINEPVKSEANRILQNGISPYIAKLDDGTPKYDVSLLWVKCKGFKSVEQAYGCIGNQFGWRDIYCGRAWEGYVKEMEDRPYAGFVFYKYNSVYLGRRLINISEHNEPGLYISDPSLRKVIGSSAEGFYAVAAVVTAEFSKVISYTKDDLMYVNPNDETAKTYIGSNRSSYGPDEVLHPRLAERLSDSLGIRK